jgi:hypothetical protein
MKPHRTGQRHVWWRVTVPLLALHLLAGALVACGSKDSGNGVASVNGNSAAPSAKASATPAADDAERMLQFTKCLREHGLNVQDPGPDGQPKLDPNTDPNKRQQALDACRSLAPGALANGGLSNEDRNQMLAFIQCLRAHGIAVDDPDPTTGMPQRKDFNKFRNPDEDMKKAMDACKDKRPQGLGGH